MSPGQISGEFLSVSCVVILLNNGTGQTAQICRLSCAIVVHM